MAFMAPLFVLETWRMVGGLASLRLSVAGSDARRQWWAFALGKVARFAAPIMVIAAAAATYNYVRFSSLTEFGHSYLQVRQQQQIEQFGLFNLHYLARNLAVAFTLLPPQMAFEPRRWMSSLPAVVFTFTSAERA